MILVVISILIISSYVFSSLLMVNLPGIYFAVTIIIINEILYALKVNISIKKIFVSLLYVNFLLSFLNIIWFNFSGFDQFTSLFLAEDDMNNVTRSVSFMGYELILVRPYGVTTNIHITALLNLIFYAYIYTEMPQKRIIKRSILFLILISYNLQVILMLILFMYINGNRRVRVAKIIYSFVFMILLFYLFDMFFMSSAYFDQIAKTFDSNIMHEIYYYISLIDSLNVLYGIRLNAIDDPFDGSYYSIPLIDIGFFNIVIQYGIVGIALIVLSYIYLYKSVSENGKKILIVNLFSLIHYFNIISFICFLSVYFVFQEKKDLHRHNADRLI